MRTPIIIASLVGFVLLVVVILGWALEYNDLIRSGFFMPRREQIRNDTFHKSQAYTDGMRRELGQLRSDYLRAKDDAQRDSDCAVVRSDFAGYDPSGLTPELRDFRDACLR